VTVVGFAFDGWGGEFLGVSVKEFFVMLGGGRVVVFVAWSGVSVGVRTLAIFAECGVCCLTRRGCVWVAAFGRTSGSVACCVGRFVVCGGVAGPVWIVV